MAQQAFYLFCNIGWMAQYDGLKGKPDKIVGGGSHVDEFGNGGEVCNFVRCSDGYVYGHVETIKGDRDTNITIQELGASRKDDSVGEIVVVWIARHPGYGGRYVVGWYRNAEVFRQRQVFGKYPSTQHRRDKIENFRIRTKAKDAALIPIEKRILRLPKGWMGRRAYWFPHNHFDEDPAIEEFLHRVNEFLDGTSDDSTDIAEIISNTKLSSTEKEALIRARIGQNQFRDFLLSEWKGCAVSGCNVPELLRASHIKPWRNSNNQERLDHENGLLLVATLDAAFDSGLITFSDTGKMLISSSLTAEDRRLLGLTKGLKLRKRPSKSRRAYLQYHRAEKFRT